MLLQELLNSKIKYIVTKETAKVFSTQAEIGGRTIHFEAINDGEQGWMIDFAEVVTKNNRVGHNFGRTGSGSELQVFSMIVDSMKEFEARYNPTMITFTADKDGDSDTRAKLYRRLADKYFKGWKREEFNHGNTTHFTYTKEEV